MQSLKIFLFTNAKWVPVLHKIVFFLGTFYLRATSPKEKPSPSVTILAKSG